MNIAQSDAETLLGFLRECMAAMISEERISISERLMEGYCKYCGDSTARQNCHCWNDE